MKSKLNTSIISALAIILLMLLTTLFFLVYKSYQYKDQTIALKAEANLSAYRRANISSVRAALSSAEPEVAVIESRFIKEENLPDFISSIERLGVDSNVYLNIASVDLEKVELKVPKKTEAKPANTVQPPRNLRMRVDGTGSWQNVVRFISALESRHSALFIQGMSLAKTVPPAEKPEATWRFSADIVQFVSN